MLAYSQFASEKLAFCDTGSPLLTPLRTGSLAHKLSILLATKSANWYGSSFAIDFAFILLNYRALGAAREIGMQQHTIGGVYRSDDILDRTAV